jgi:hypothetical protein
MAAHSVGMYFYNHPRMETGHVADPVWKKLFMPSWWYPIDAFLADLSPMTGPSLTLEELWTISRPRRHLEASIL